MKKKIRLSVCLFTLLVLACSKSGDPAPTFIGTWKLDTSEVMGCTGPNAFNYSETACGVAIPFNGGTYTNVCSTMVIAPSTITLTGGGMSQVYDYTKTGDTITFNAFTFTYTVTNTKLTLTRSYDQGCKNISKLTRQ